MAKSLLSVVFLQLSAAFDSKSYAEFNATSPRGFVFLLWKITCRCASLKSVLSMIPILLSFQCSLPVRYFLSMEIPSGRSVTIS